MKVKVINRSRHELPQYETPQSAGLDIRANVDSPVVLKPLERKLVPTGLYVELPVGYEAQIRHALGRNKGAGFPQSFSSERQACRRGQGGAEKYAFRPARIRLCRIHIAESFLCL